MSSLKTKVWRRSRVCGNPGMVVKCYAKANMRPLITARSRGFRPEMLSDRPVEIPYRSARSHSGRWIFRRRDCVTTVGNESRLSKSGSIAVSQRLLSSPGSGRVRNLSCARRERDRSKQARSVRWSKRGRYIERGFVGKNGAVVAGRNRDRTMQFVRCGLAEFGFKGRSKLGSRCRKECEAADSKRMKADRNA